MYSYVNWLCEICDGVSFAYDANLFVQSFNIKLVPHEPETCTVYKASFYKYVLTSNYDIKA